MGGVINPRADSLLAYRSARAVPLASRSTRRWARPACSCMR